jgi:hypothetical protein
MQGDKVDVGIAIGDSVAVDSGVLVDVAVTVGGDARVRPQADKINPRNAVTHNPKKPRFDNRF